MIDFVCENNSNELCDTGKNQISMKCFFVLGSASCKAKVIFDVIDIPFNNGSDFISIIPFICSTNGAGLSTQILFRININHSS